MIRDSVIIAEVENFIKRWNNGELLLTPQAKEMIVDYTRDEKNFWGKPKHFKKPLPDYLGYAVTSYQEAREMGFSRYLFDKAYALLDTIQRARAYRVIVDTKQQVTDYEKKIESLKEQNAKLRDLNTRLALENKRLHNLLPPDTKKGDTEVGSVN